MRRHLTIVEDLLNEFLNERSYGNLTIGALRGYVGKTKSTLAQIEKQIHKNGFSDEANEIFFYKHLKAPINALEITYTLIIRIEQHRALSTKTEIQKLIKETKKYIKLQFQEYKQFLLYFKNGEDDKDEYYFLKKNKCDIHLNPLLNAQLLTTGYDIIAAYQLAYEHFTKFYEKEHQENNSKNEGSKLKWNSNKIDFIELISGLYLMNVISADNSDFKHIATELAKFLNIEINDLYGKRKEIKNRKGERLKFLKEMVKRLEQDLENGDE